VQAATADTPGTDRGPRARRSRLRTALEVLGAVPAPPSGHAFHAFISYSHAADERLAPAVQSGLQRFARPWYRARALRIFRDNANLAANPHLWSSIQDALDSSQHFILLASPEAAASPWVQRECAHWRTHDDRCERLLIAVTGGEIAWNENRNDFDWRATTALPRGQLEGAFAGEPRFIDLRWARGENDLALAHPRFRESIAELAAPLHDVPKEELISDEVRERKRAVRLARAAAASLALLTVAALVAGVLALVARNQAQTNEQQAVSRSLALEAEDALGAAGSQLGVNPSRGVLLSLEAYRAAHTTAAQGAVIEALEYTDRIENFLDGAGGYVGSVAYSPDGHTVALLTQERGVQLWDLRSGRMIAGIGLPPLHSCCDSPTISFNASGTELALARPDKGISIYSVATGRPLGPPIQPGQLFSTVAFAGADELVAGAPIGAPVARPTGEMEVLNLRTGAEVGHAQCAAGSSLGSIAATPHGGEIAGSCDPGGVVIWRASDHYAAVARVAAGLQAIGPIALSRDGTRLAIGRTNGALAVWDLSGSQPTMVGTERQSNDGQVKSLALSPDGGRIAVGYDDGEGRIWGLTGTAPQWSFQASPATLYGLAFGPNGRTLLAGGADGVATAWAVPGASAAYTSPLATSIPKASTVVAFGAGAGELASYYGNGLVGLWKLEGGRPISGPRPAGPRGVAAFALSADGRLLATAPIDASVRVTLIDPDQPGQPLRTLPHFAAVGGGGPLAFSPDATLLAVADQAGVLLANLRTGTATRLRDPSGVFSLAFNPQGTVLATYDGNGAINLWPVARPGEGPQLLARPASDLAAGPNAIAFSPDGDTVAAATTDGVSLWNVSSQTLLGTISPEADAGAVAFSPDGSILAMGQLNGDLQLFNVATQQPLGRPLADYGVNSVAFSPDGSLLATAGAGAMVWNQLLWSGSEFNERQARLCQLVGRNLSRTEWSVYVPGQPYHRTCPQWP
jgi:WD40 repeat protein